MLGFLTTLTDHCTGLRTLVLSRIGHARENMIWDTAAEEASYVEWASFIRSVQGTVEKLAFEQRKHLKRTNLVGDQRWSSDEGPGREIPAAGIPSYYFGELALLDQYGTPRCRRLQKRSR